MSNFRNFALVGFGELGTFVAEELLKAKAAGKADKVVILTRPKSTGREGLLKFADAGATVIGVNFSDKEAMSQALAGVDAVISTLPRSQSALDAEMTVAGASKAAGAKLFVPSDFGFIATSNAMPEKLALREKLRAISLPYALFFCGPWSDIMFPDDFWSPLAGTKIDHTGEVTIGADGSKPISCTARVDVARFVVYILTQLPAETLEYKVFHMDGDRKSFNEIFEAYEVKTGKSLKVTKRGISDRDLQAAVAANPMDVGARLHLIIALGDGASESIDNALYPDWNPTPIIDFLT
ncbi:NAD-P-binding protein [Artomyces pyxidatus]|uniref:NAD-P-binding protein n=1 Tax=Artomyces pyxidatus TaxID=48021 RepID=A0ACB8TGR0_9AGAM|nr:NAD-P-binding protein [Artomyces pyxidatus]